MKTIQVKSEIFFLEWQLKRQDIKALDIDEHLFAKGGYSSLYEIKTDLVHGFNSNVRWLLKISFASDPICKAGYRNITELSSKLAQWQGEKYENHELLFIEYQALIGFPQAHFVGEYEGHEIYGYILPNLNDLGYTLFSEIEDNEKMHEDYLNTTFDFRTFNNRLKTVYNLAKIFQLLEEKFEYLHGDIKAKSVWVNLSTNETALIDFDGGMFRQKFWENLKRKFGAPIMGEQQPWLAPEILKEVNESTGNAKLEVSWQSDYWSFTCGAFHLLTGLAPFSFLRETTFLAWKEYLKSCDWPSLETGSDRLLIQKEEADDLNAFFGVISPRKGIWGLFKTTFNKGFKNKLERASYGDWANCLLSEIADKRPVTKVNVSPKIILEESEVDISWECDSGLILINGASYPKQGNITQIVVQLPVIKVLNEFGTWPVELNVEIVRKPIITRFECSSTSIPVGQTIEFNWQSNYVDTVNAIVDGHNFQLTGNRFECSPKSSQEIEVKFASKYGLEILSKTLAVEVVYPVVIENFVSDKEFIAETLPVLLKWETKNADEINISNIERSLEKSGEISIRPKYSGDITLTARNKFFNCEKSIYVEIFPIPKIENVKLPPFPDLDFKLPDFTYGIPILLKKIEAPKELFNQIFTENGPKKDS